MLKITEDCLEECHCSDYWQQHPELFMYNNTVLDVLFCGVLVLNREGLIITLNISAEKIIKEKKKNIIGKNIKDVDCLKEIFRVIILNNGHGRYKISINKTNVIANLNNFDKNEVNIGSVVIFHKSGDAECINQELDVTENLLREINTILESSYNGMYITDNKGIVVRVNAAFERIFSVNRKKILGKTIYKLIEENLFSKSAILNTLDNYQTSTVIYENNGRKISEDYTPEFNKKRKINNVVVNVRDITELEGLRRKMEYQQMVMEGYIRELSDRNNHINENKNFIAYSKEMQKIIDTISFISAVNSSVLITGESGSGKEVIVNQIYHSSVRKDKPIIKINCGAIPTNLFESELFGYEDGAFTGAKRKGKIGLFELANEGTLFLDEIGEMSLDAQVKLLRAIQEKEIIRIGGSSSIPVDVRLIAATNQDLKKLIREGKFRQDLYYRLNVINIEIPPLRQRRDDIIPLAIHFMKIFNEKYHKKKELSIQAAKILRSMDWPGNIRELENLIENMVVLIQEDIIMPYHLHERYKTNLETETQIVVNGIIPMKKAVTQVESQLIQNAQKKFTTTTDIAKALGVNQSTISRKMQQLNIHRNYE